MAFPNTGILDNFNRPDGPVGDNWTGNGVIISQEYQAFFMDDHWSASFEEPIEIYCTLRNCNTDDSDGPILFVFYDVYKWYWLHCTQGYSFQEGWHHELQFARGLGNQAGEYLLKNSEGMWKDGDRVGFRIDRGTLEAYYCPLGGNWRLAMRIVDTTFSGPAYTGIGIAYNPETVDDFGGGTATRAPTCLIAHIAGDEIDLAWRNAETNYTALRVERSSTRDGAYTDLSLGLQPDAVSAVDGNPGAFDLWYRVVATGTHGDATTDPVQAVETTQAAWDTIAHAIGISDLAAPFQPFLFGSAGEILFLVCCRLWRMGADPALPDPIGSDPADWQTYLETGTWPT